LQFDWINTLLLLGALQGFILATVLVFATGNNAQANKVLALLVFTFSINLIIEVSYDSGAYFNWSWLIGLDTPIEFMYGPLLWFYTQLLISESDFSLKKHFWHFLPTILILLLWSGFFFSPSEQKISHLSELISRDSLDDEILFYWLALLIQVLIYTLLVIIDLTRFQTKLKDCYSQIERINLNWLVILVCAIGVIWLAGSFQIIALAIGLDVSRQVLMLPTVSIVLTVYLIGYMGLRQPKIFLAERDTSKQEPRDNPDNRSKDNDEFENRTNQKKEIDNAWGDKSSTQSKVVLGDLQTSSPVEKKTPGFRLSGERVAILEQRLKSLMAEEKPFLQPELRLRSLAESLNAPEHHVTLLFNEHLGIRFYDYINRKRIEHAILLLADPQGKAKSVLQICFESGFNSKSTFYSLFKQATQQTPSAYQKANLS
jgi:AraC-like DNA-binding protein